MNLEELEQLEEAPNVSAELVKAVRLFHGWTQEGFAALFDVSRRTVIRWEERGTFFPDPGLNPMSRNGRVWKQIHVRFEAAAAYRLTPEGVVEVVSAEAESARLDPVTFATRGALDALAKKRHV